MDGAGGCRIRCREMIDYYGDDGFLSRNGKKLCELGRYFLDFRQARVRDYLDGVIAHLVCDLGVDYLKFDYNQDCGAEPTAMHSAPAPGWRITFRHTLRGWTVCGGGIPD